MRNPDKIKTVNESMVDFHKPSKPAILGVINRFVNRESTTGFIEDYKKYIKDSK